MLREICPCCFPVPRLLAVFLRVTGTAFSNKSFNKSGTRMVLTNRELCVFICYVKFCPCCFPVPRFLAVFMRVTGSVFCNKAFNKSGTRMVLTNREPCVFTCYVKSFLLFSRSTTSCSLFAGDGKCF